ncbi:hypothetical protein AB0M39_38255 [Streptomyces sp. NPDC051907]|uniref:hypothetical protein n=1 Tax=Streptomyces sp. NPDC051907 TaxID=3155284 RepID=UPI0034194698
MSDFEDVLSRALLSRRRALRLHLPEQLAQVTNEAYARALENVIGLTAGSHEEAEKLVMAVLAPMLLAPRDLLARDGLDAKVFTDRGCPWALLRPDGEVVFCDVLDPVNVDEQGRPVGCKHEEPDLHEAHHPDGYRFHESDSNAIHVPTWRGEA